MSDFDQGNHNKDGFAVMENEVYEDVPEVDPEEEKKAAAERKR
jgi:hypothetical protein